MTKEKPPAIKLEVNDVYTTLKFTIITEEVKDNGKEHK